MTLSRLPAARIGESALRSAAWRSPLLAGAGIAAAMSSDFGGRVMGGFGGHMMHARMGGMGFGERRLDYMLEEIDATPEQSTKLKAIIEAARTDIMPMAEGFGGTREEIAKLLGARDDRPRCRREAAQRAHRGNRRGIAAG